MKDLIGLMGNEKGAYMGALACAVLLGMAEAFIHPLLVKAIFDTVLVARNLSEVIWLSAAYLFFGVAINVASFVLGLWNMRIENRIVAAVSSDLLSTFYRKSYAGVLRNGEGYYVSRIRSDVKDGLVPALKTFRLICVGIATFVSLVTVLIFLSWQAFLIMIVIIPIASGISIYVSRKIKHTTNLERDSEAFVVGILSKAISSFRLVNSFRLHSVVADRFRGGLKDVLDAGYSRFKLVSTLRGSSDLVMVCCDAASMFVGAYFVFQRQMTIGSFIAFMNAFWRSTTTLMAIFNNIAEFHNHSTIASRLVSFGREDMGESYQPSAGGVAARSLEFAYSGVDPLLNGMSFKLEAGQRVLVVGENGAGKSTLANMMAGLLRPTGGSISLPERISSVTLPIVFPQIELQNLNVSGDLLKEFGLSTNVCGSTQPGDLSVGQQQKLALAMALSKDADLYILDEPFSNLDTGSRRSVMEQILRRTQGKVLVLIMHDHEAYQDLFDETIVITRPVSQG